MIGPENVLRGSVAAYGATLGVAVLGVLPLTPSPGRKAYVGVGIGVFLVVLAGARSARHLQESIDGKTALAMLAVPVGSFGWFLATILDRGLVRYPLGVGAVAVVPAGTAVVAAHEARLRERTERATELASFEARLPPGWRRSLVAGYAVVVVGLLAVGGVLLVDGGDAEPITTFAPALGGSTAVLPALMEDREVRLTDEGVRIGRAFHDWDAFESYAITDEAVVLVRDGWCRSHRYDRSDVDDVETVDRTLGRYLPRRSD